MFYIWKILRLDLDRRARSSNPDLPVEITITDCGIEAPSTEPLLVLVTDGVDATAQALRDRGVPILAEPAEWSFQPGHTAAAFQDS